jgi:hypothetical protein
MSPLLDHSDETGGHAPGAHRIAKFDAVAAAKSSSFPVTGGSTSTDPTCVPDGAMQMAAGRSLFDMVFNYQHKLEQQPHHHHPGWTSGWVRLWNDPG